MNKNNGIEIFYNSDGTVARPRYSASKKNALAGMPSMINMNSYSGELAGDFVEADDSDESVNGITKLIEECSAHEEIFHFGSRRIVVPVSHLPEQLCRGVNNYLNGAPFEKNGLDYFTPTGNKRISFDDTYSENKVDQEHFS